MSITESVCKEILRAYSSKSNLDSEFSEFSTEPTSDDPSDGMLSNHLFLNIASKRQTLRFFLKTHPSDASLSNFITSAKMVRKEINAYNFFQTDCRGFDTSFAPKFFYSKDDNLIVLEDLSQKGFRIWSDSLEMNLEHLEVALRSLAKYHATSFGELGRKEREELGESMFVKKEGCPGYMYVETGFKALCELAKLVPSKRVGHREVERGLRMILDDLYERIKPQSGFRNIRCHGDLWPKNFLFRYQDGKPVECKIVDYQLERYNPPAHDVTCLIFNSTNRLTRQKHYHHLLDFYYKALQTELAKHQLDMLSYPEFLLTCKLTMPMAKAAKAIYKTLSSLGPETLTEIIGGQDKDRYRRVLFENRNDEAIKEFSTNKYFRRLMTEMIEELQGIVEHDVVSLEDVYKIVEVKLKTKCYEVVDYKEHAIQSDVALKVMVKIEGEVEVYSFVVKRASKFADKVGKGGYVCSCPLGPDNDLVVFDMFM